MKKILFVFIAVLFFNMVDAQTSANEKQKMPAIVKGDLPVNKTPATIIEQVDRKKIIISPNPIPKADSASEARSRRKQPQVIRDLKTN